jgi:hypothetical protein
MHDEPPAVPVVIDVTAASPAAADKTPGRARAEPPAAPVATSAAATGAALAAIPAADPAAPNDGTGGLDGTMRQAITTGQYGSYHTVSPQDIAITQEEAKNLDGALQASDIDHYEALELTRALQRSAFEHEMKLAAQAQHSATPQTLVKAERIDSDSPHKNNESRLHNDAM